MTEPLLFDVRRILADVLKRSVEEVPVDATRDGLDGWDSMAHLNLVLALEQHFDVQFSPEEMMEILSVELMAMLVDEKRAAKGAG